jgi:hypothetical protein
LATLSPNERDGELSAESHWLASPLNYLEKIIQIPYTLRPMTPDGFASLVATQMPARAAATATEPPTQSTEATDEPLTPGLDSGDTQASARTPDEQAPQAPIGSEKNKPLKRTPVLFRIDPQPVEVTPAEVEFMALLAPLVSTPRATKKLTNVYRLLRASLPPDERRVFVDEEGFRPAMVILAIVIGRPLRSGMVLKELKTADPESTFETFVNSLGPVSDATRECMVWRNGQELSLVDQDVWTRFQQELKDVLHAEDQVKLGQIPLYDFQRWLTEAARFSFHTGGLLANPAPARNRLDGNRAAVTPPSS